MTETPSPGEQWLAGNVGGAVLVGETIRRPTGPWTPAVHGLLNHLATYLNGRIVDGQYFLQRRAPGLTGVDFDRDAVIGLCFRGRQRCGSSSTGTNGSGSGGGRYESFRLHYGDVHERNVLFEVFGRRERATRVPARGRSGRMRLVRVGLQPVDVR